MLAVVKKMLKIAWLRSSGFPSREIVILCKLIPVLGHISYA